MNTQLLSKWLAPSLLLLSSTMSQAVIAVGNLGNDQASGWIVGNGVGDTIGDTPIANSFSTGAGPGWTLNNLTLILREDVSVAGSITVELFSDNAGVPGSSLAVLSGPDPAGTTPAPYVYTPGPTVPLSGNTAYWVVVSGPITGGLPDNYEWTNTADTSESPALPGWSIGNTTFEASSGTSSATWSGWSPLISDFPTMFSVDVTPVPEPTSGLLLAMSSLLFLYRRR